MRLHFAPTGNPDLQSGIVTPGQTWPRPAPRMALDLSGRQANIAPLLEAPIKTHTTSLDRLTQARLTWSDCFTLPDGLFHPSLGDAKYQAWALSVRDAGSLAQTTAGLSEEDGHTLIDDEKFARIEDIDQRMMFATPQEPHNWGLFLLSSVPAIGTFLSHRADYDKLFVYYHHPNMRALAALMGVQANDTHPHDVFRSYRFRKIDILRQSNLDCFVDAPTQSLFQSLAARATARNTGPRAPRIFIARLSRSQEPQAPRAFAEEQALAATLAEHGFVTIEPEKLPSIAQIQLFAQAEMIVGPSGAGLFNTVFCRPGTKIVSIESMPELTERHATLYASLNLDYSIILGQQDTTDLRENHRRFTLNLPVTLAHIRSFLGL